MIFKLRHLATSPAKRMATITLLVLAAQVALGVSNVVFHFPIAVAVSHNLVGAILLLCMVTLNYLLRTAVVHRGGVRI